MCMLRINNIKPRPFKPINQGYNNMEFSSKPNYFLFAQLLIRHIENYVKKHQDAQNAIFDLRDVYEIFRQD